MINKQFLGILTILFVLYACKRSELISKPQTFKEEIQLLKDSFKYRGIDKKLLKIQLQDNNVSWVPLWDSIKKAAPSELQSFYYIPLKPTIVGSQRKVFVTGIQKYLLVSQTEAGFEYTEAFYFPDNSVRKKTASSKDFFKNFTGTLTARSLDKDRAYGFDYVNGTIVKSPRKTIKTMTRSATTLADGHYEQQCDLVFICTYAAEQCSDVISLSGCSSAEPISVSSGMTNLVVK